MFKTQRRKKKEGERTKGGRAGRRAGGKKRSGSEKRENVIGQTDEGTGGQIDGHRESQDDRLVNPDI